MTFQFIYITTKDETQAKQIGKTVVEERLAACANILPRITSIYRWEEKLCQDEEAVLILKSRSDKFEELKSRVIELHSYDVPCIIALDIKEGHHAYLDWIEAQTS